MKLTGVNQLWVADITYIRLTTEFVYLAVILDGYSRKVVGVRAQRKKEIWDGFFQTELSVLELWELNCQITYDNSTSCSTPTPPWMKCGKRSFSRKGGTMRRSERQALVDTKPLDESEASLSHRR